ncbi:MAG: hypothetical protein F6K62_25760 [Sphaerospermopsis sp. SIO1G2]|nr:hypothetical protein [Sphaerospermopsis sp. SIO1G2]
MSSNKELEIQMQFLEEATDYLNSLESILLEIDPSKHLDLDKINAAMRNAHSIKGGAAMMGFKILSNLAHRLEDSFKVLKTRKSSLKIDTHLQSLLLSAVDWLRQIVNLLSEEKSLDDKWLQTFCYPIFDELHQHLGDSPPEDITTILSSEDVKDIIPLLFETEVEECLQNLESLLTQSSPPELQTALKTMAGELAGLGEMLQLPNFIQLCQSVHQHLEKQPERCVEIAQSALQAWRRSQALVLTNQQDRLPINIELEEVLIENPGEVEVQTKIEIPENSLLVDEFIPDLESVEIELPPEINAVEFPDPNVAFSQEIPSVDYQHIDRKNDNTNYYKDKEIHENTVRVPSKQLEEMNDLFGEIIIQRNGLNSQLDKLRKLVLVLSQRVQTLHQENQEIKLGYENIFHQIESSTPLTETENQTQNTKDNFDLDSEQHQQLNITSYFCYLNYCFQHIL